MYSLCGKANKMCFSQNRSSHIDISFIQVRYFHFRDINRESSHSYQLCMTNQHLTDGRVNIAWGISNLPPCPSTYKVKWWGFEQLNLYKNKIQLYFNKLSLLVKVLLYFQTFSVINCNSCIAYLWNMSNSVLLIASLPWTSYGSFNHDNMFNWLTENL